MRVTNAEDEKKNSKAFQITITVNMIIQTGCYNNNKTNGWMSTKKSNTNVPEQY